MIWDKDLVEKSLNPLTHPYLNLAQGRITQAVRDGDIRYLNSIQGQMLMDNLNLTQEEKDSLMGSATTARREWGREVYWQGKKISISELSRQTGLTYQVLYDRICIRGWDVEKAVKTGRLPKKGKMYMWNGKESNLTEISLATGIKLITLYNRIHRQGLSLEEAVNLPVKKREIYNYNGKKATIGEIAELTGISVPTLESRMYKCGMTIQQAIAKGKVHTRRGKDE